MNIWDSMHASCGAPEEKDDSHKPRRIPKPANVTKPSTGILSSAASGGNRKGKISYRELIFGGAAKYGPSHSVIFNAYRDSSLYQDPSKKKRKKRPSDVEPNSSASWSDLILHNTCSKDTDITLLSSSTLASQYREYHDPVLAGDYNGACGLLTTVMEQEKEEERRRSRILDIISFKPLTMMEIITSYKKLAFGGLDASAPGTFIEDDLETKIADRLKRLLVDGQAKEVPISPKYPEIRYTISIGEDVKRLVVASAPLKVAKPWKSFPAM